MRARSRDHSPARGQDPRFGIVIRVVRGHGGRRDRKALEHELDCTLELGDREATRSGILVRRALAGVERIEADVQVHGRRPRAKPIERRLESRERTSMN
jgi:hypothetical protein